MQFHRQVESGLTSEGGQDSVRAFAAYNFVEDILGQRFDICTVGEIRVSHNGCGVGVYEYDLISLLLQSLAGLYAGVVEFAGLTDHDRAGTDKHNFLQIVTFRHLFFPLLFKSRLNKAAE